MRRHILVKVPVNAETSYSLFAQGLKIDVSNTDENEDFISFKFMCGTVVALFYTFAEFRRAYLVTGWESGSDGEKIFLPGIDMPLRLVLKAKGRKIDRLKHALRWLTKEDEYAPFRLPVAFWRRLAGIIECGGGRQSDIARLYEKFKDGTE